MTTDIHKPLWHQPLWHQPHWQQSHGRMAPDMPLISNRSYKMALIVGINCMLWVAVLATAWFVTQG